MDLQTSLLLNFTYFPHDKSMDELRQSLLLTMELEDTRLHAQEELNIRDQQIAHLKDLAGAAITERNQAQEKCQRLMFEKLLLQQRCHHQSTPHSAVSSVEEDCDESIVSSPAAEEELPVLIDRPLPEKGKLLQAVMKAGPLLQTLLLAGPLPQWRHPPPPLDAYQIPAPVALLSSRQPSLNEEALESSNCGAMNRKRGLSEISDSGMNKDLKYQRIVLQ